MDLRVTEYEPNRKFTLKYSSGRLKGATSTRSMETIEGKTRLTNTFSAKFSGFYKLAGPIAARMVKRSTVAQLGNIKRLLESGAPYALKRDTG